MKGVPNRLKVKDSLDLKLRGKVHLTYASPISERDVELLIRSSGLGDISDLSWSLVVERYEDKPGYHSHLAFAWKSSQVIRVYSHTYFDVANGDGLHHPHIVHKEVGKKDTHSWMWLVFNEYHHKAPVPLEELATAGFPMSANPVQSNAHLVTARVVPKLNFV